MNFENIRRRIERDENNTIVFQLSEPHSFSSVHPEADSYVEEIPGSEFLNWDSGVSLFVTSEYTLDEIIDGAIALTGAHYDPTLSNHLVKDGKKVGCGHTAGEITAVYVGSLKPHDTYPQAQSADLTIDPSEWEAEVTQ